MAFGVKRVAVGPITRPPLSDSLSGRAFFHYKGEKRPDIKKVLPDNEYGQLTKPRIRYRANLSETPVYFTKSLGPQPDWKKLVRNS
jgi:hypothetical protein